VRRILKGDTAAFFKAAERVIGKPRQALEVNQDHAGKLVICWQRDDIISRLEAGRTRVADSHGDRDG